MNTPLREAIQREIRLRKARLAANASEKPLDRILPWTPMQGPKGKALDSVAATLDEGVRFPTCAPAPLEALFAATGLSGVVTQAIEVPIPFRNFEDYWSPFLGGQGPAPGFAMSLPEDRRIALRELIRCTLRTDPDGSIQLTARAWGVRGTKPEGPTPPG